MRPTCHPDRPYKAKGLCVKCYGAKQSRDYLKEHPESRHKKYGSMLLKRYGITLEEYKQLKQAQEGQCVLCHKRPKRLVLDHNHNTGKLRGFVCDICNRYLEKLDSDLTLLERLREYLV